MTNSTAVENILSELDNPNLFSEEREALQILLAALMAEKWNSESDHREMQILAA